MFAQLFSKVRLPLLPSLPPSHNLFYILRSFLAVSHLKTQLLRNRSEMNRALRRLQMPFPEQMWKTTFQRRKPLEAIRRKKTVVQTHNRPSNDKATEQSLFVGIQVTAATSEKKHTPAKVAARAPAQVINSECFATSSSREIRKSLNLAAKCMSQN